MAIGPGAVAASAAATASIGRATLAGIGALPLYPALVAAALVLNTFVESTAAVYVLWRPLVAITAATFALTLVVAVATRNRHIGAALTLGAVLVLAGYDAVALGLVGAVLLALIVAVVGRHAIAIPWELATKAGNLFAVVLLAVTAGEAVSVAGVGVAPLPPAAVAEHPAAPDIYVLLLDAHPGLRTMSEEFGLEPSEFAGAMRDLGFDVSYDSRANYNATTLTLASIFNMKLASDVITDVPRSTREQFRASTAAINRGPGLTALRAHGYEVVTIASPVSDVTLTSADLVIDSGDITDLELTLLQKPGAKRLLAGLQRAFVPGSLRHRLEWSLFETARLASERRGGPRFVITHLMSPHAPYLYDASGAPVEPWPCFPIECPTFYGGQSYGVRTQVAGARGQIAHVDNLVVATVRAIIANSDRPPVIIVLSDHGHRHDLADRAEGVENLFMAYTPGHAELFAADTTPVNLIATLLNTYVDAGLPMVPERSFWVDIRTIQAEGLLDLVPAAP